MCVCVGVCVCVCSQKNLMLPEIKKTNKQYTKVHIVKQNAFYLLSV